MKSKHTIWLALVLILAACNRQAAQVIYTEKTITKTDTLTVKTIEQVPCDDFEAGLFDENEKDTVYVKVADKQITVKYVRTRDTVYLTPNIITPQPKKLKVDNSVKATKGSAVGDGNKLTTKKSNWWWIFLAGALSMFIVQNVVWRTVKIYFPILNVIK